MIKIIQIKGDYSEFAVLIVKHFLCNFFEHLQIFQIKLFINLCNIRWIGTNTFFWLIKHVQKFDSIQVYYSLLF
jgi:hypothetical protein